MTNIKIVSGLNYGDESKGLVANFLSTPTSLTIMASNSCQRGHTATNGKIRKVFRHFGCGTLKGAATYFAKYFYVNPAMFRREYEELIQLGIAPTVYARTGCTIVTPIDMFANVNVEMRRGDEAHSSTGVGMWETFCRHKHFQKTGDSECIDNIIRYYKKVLKDEKGQLPLGVELFLNGPALKANCIDDWDFMWEHVYWITSDEEERELLHSYQNIVFENSQGLLLDDDYNFDYIHNTPAHVGARMPMEIIKANFNDDEVWIDNYYVSRTYLTRHGKGQIGVTENLECDKEEINPDMVDLTNVPNPNQGTLRYGTFTTREAIAAVERMAADDKKIGEYQGTRNLVITHTNEYNDGQLLTAAKRYGGLKKIFISDNEYDIRES